MDSIRDLYNSESLRDVIDKFGHKIGWDDLADFVQVKYNSNDNTITVKPEGGLSKEDIEELADYFDTILDDPTLGIEVLPGKALKLFDAYSEYGTSVLSDYDFKLGLEDKLNEGLDLFGYDDYDYDIEELGDGRVKVEVRAELDYDEFSEVIDNYLNPFIQKYDKDTYFEMEMPGIAVAFLDQTRRINR